MVMRTFLPEKPIVSCIVLGEIIGAVFGLVEVILEHVKYGFSEKLGAVFQLGFGAPLYVAFFVLGGIVFGAAIGLGLTVVRPLYSARSGEGHDENVATSGSRGECQPPPQVHTERHGVEDDCRPRDT
jgi:hypothetical protein